MCCFFVSQKTFFVPKGKKVCLEGHFLFPKEIIWVPKDGIHHMALTKLLVFLNCCTDHSTIKCGKKPLRFGGKSLQSLSEAENRFEEKHLKRKLRAVPGCRCQIAQNHYQKERDLTLNCTQQDRRQKPRSSWQVKLLLQLMIFQPGMQHCRCRLLTFVTTITPDCDRHEFLNTADIFFHSH